MAGRKGKFSEWLLLAKAQGEIFEKSMQFGLDSCLFVEKFMLSENAAAIDGRSENIPLGNTIWQMVSFLKHGNVPKGKIWHDCDMMFYFGYVYRHWHLCTGLPSREIYKIADISVMTRNYRYVNDVFRDGVKTVILKAYEQKGLPAPVFREER